VSQHDTVPTDADITRDRGSIDPDHYTPEEKARWEYTDGLHALANFLERTPGAPLPSNYMTKHYPDADDFDRAATALGVDSKPSPGGYEVAHRDFGPIHYGIQTDGRKAQQIRRREEAIAARERELGLSDDDLGAAA
jgi:hypothetical protein